MLLSTGGFFGANVGGATAPAQFGTGDWSVTDDGTGGDITITITALPDDGGSAITDLEYQIDGGSWTSLGGTTTGSYPVSGLTEDVEVDVAIRAVNAIGTGTASATKAVTPTAAPLYVLAYKTTTAQNLSSTPAAITFNAEIFDNISAHNTGSNTSRFTVGATYDGRYARFSASVNISAGGETLVATRDGSPFAGSGAIYAESSGTTTGGFMGAIVPVSTGQYFEVFASTTVASTALASSLTWGQLEYLPEDFQGCLLTKTATQAVSASTTTQVQFGSGSEIYDLGGWFDAGSPDYVTVPADTTLVRITGQAESANVNGQFLLGTHVDTGSGFVDYNGAFAIDTERNGKSYVNGATGPIAVSPGHKFRISVYGEAQTLPISDRTFLQIERLPNNLKYCRVRRSSNMALSAATSTPVQWNVEDVDVGGWFDAGSPDSIVVPSGTSGRVRMFANLNGSSQAGQFVLSFTKNGVDVGVSGYDTDTSGADFANAKSAIINVVPGDVLRCLAYSALARNVTAGSWFSVEEVILETRPAQFGTGDWSVADDGTGGDITITITALPDDGGSAITDLQYQIDGGSWVSLGGTTTGDYPVSGLTDDVEVDVSIRAVNAIGAGTASATKAVTPFTTVLLLGFGGSNGSTTFTDESPSAHGNATIATGTPQVTTSVSKFGGSSLNFSASNCGIHYANHADFNFADRDFTVETFVRFASLSSTDPYKVFLSKWAGVNGRRGWIFDLHYQGTLRFGYSRDGDEQIIASTSWLPALNTWYHMVAERKGPTLRVYVDGVPEITYNIGTDVIFASTDPLRIGHQWGSSRLYGWLRGYFDEVRISNVARYDTDTSFTVPTAEFPRL